MIKKFNKINGKYIEKIYGQDRLAYAMSDTEDFYDLIEWSKQGGYQGSVILFYDFENGKVYQPFEKRKNTVFSRPVYAEGHYYFLRGCYDEKQITLFQYFPDTTLEVVVKLPMEEVDLYNLHIVGNPIHIISQDEGNIKCYYPETFAMTCEPNESIAFIEDGKVYMEAWIEEGWDEVRNCVTDQYNYYHKVIVKDYLGNILSEEIGYLHQASDGSWWIS